MSSSEPLIYRERTPGLTFEHQVDCQEVRANRGYDHGERECQQLDDDVAENRLETNSQHVDTAKQRT